MNKVGQKRNNIAKSQCNILHKCQLEDFYSTPENKRRVTTITFRTTQLPRQYMNLLIHCPCQAKKREIKRSNQDDNPKQELQSTSQASTSTTWSVDEGSTSSPKDEEKELKELNMS
eukprot:TRINITY_DN31371_c0_g1_i1.p1 TRINITY_DN31371_c0_g1~~TRINITY_DN31371_c0_g1_i1.p1  ORF type:complete len:116 (-),score=17.18 TRINITY_DN31371_c0_g1_i1:101-448(-)